MNKLKFLLLPIFLAFNTAYSMDKPSAGIPADLLSWTMSPSQKIAQANLQTNVGALFSRIPSELKILIDSYPPQRREEDSFQYDIKKSELFWEAAREGNVKILKL